MRRTGGAAAAALALVGTALLVAGCGSSGGDVVRRTAYVEFTPEQQAEIAAQKPPEYRIQRGDILRVVFPYQEGLNQDGIIVLDDGAINLIGADRLVVAGLTMTQADSLITSAYAADYRDPDVSVIVTKTRGRPVYVLGEVKQPGSYDVPSSGIDLFSAVAMAGGFNEYAAKSGTVVVRLTPEGYMCEEVDLSNPGATFSAGLAMVGLQPYDVIYVPRSRQGDFYAFARAVLGGLVNITRIASDIRYLTDRNVGRY